MYELSRARLYSTGPNGARYEDVVLNLRDLGAPVSRPSQDSLFDTDETGLLRRPSPASVLFTENGNGKSVLIKLIFAVILPGRRQVVGSSNSRVLENFVLAADVAHVALEWQHVLTGQKIVTGKASAWRGQVVSADSNKLTEAWYSFTPDGEFTLDTLPFAENGRRVSLTGFRERLTDASAAVPARQIVWEQSQGAWTEHLDNLGIDSELFAYQRRMNAGEGEAADAFTLKNDHAFVDWLLTAVTDEDDPRNLAEILDGYATTLAQRDSLIAEKDFVTGALDLLHPLAAAARDHDAAEAICREADSDAARFTAAITVRTEQETQRLALMEQQATASAEQVEAADRDQRRLNAITLEMRRTLAWLELQQAETRRATLIGERDQAKEMLAAWQATPVLLGYQEAHAAAESVRDIVGEVETQAAPALARRNSTAQLLVQGLLAVAARADTATQTATGHAATLEQQATRAAAEDTENTTLAARETTTADVLRSQITAAQQALTQAVTDGLLAARQKPADAATAAERANDDADARVQVSRAEQNRLASARTAADRKLTGAASAANQAHRAADHAARLHEQAVQVTEALHTETRLAALLGTEEVLLDTDAGALTRRLADVIGDTEQRLLTLQMAEKADQAVLTALGTGGLLPPPADVTAVQDTLTDAGITSYTGWQYLAQMPEPERDPALKAHPHLVDGVVLNDAAQLNRARHVLTDARLLPRSLVAVGVTGTLHQLDTAAAPDGLDFLVTPNPALYDENLAEQERQSLLVAQAARQVDIDTLTGTLTHDRGLQRRLQQWLETYPPGALQGLQTARDETAAAFQAATAEQVNRQAEKDELEVAEQELRDLLPELDRVLTDARRRRDQLRTLTNEQAQVGDWTDLETAARERAGRAERAADEARTLAADLRQKGGEAIRLADDHSRIANAAREEIGDVLGGGSTPPADTAPPAPVSELRADYKAAVQAYNQQQVGVDLRNQLAAADRRESETRSAMEALPAPARATATSLLSTPDGGDGPSRTAATTRTERAVQALILQADEASAVVGALRERYEQMTPQDRSLEPYGRPRDIPHAQELVERVSADWREASARLETVSGALATLQGDISDLITLRDGFRHIAEVLSASRPNTIEDGTAPYPGTLTEATTRGDTVRQALTDARAVLDEAIRELRKASSALNQYAVEPRFDKINSPVQRQMRAVAQDDLPTYAANWETALRPRLRTLTDDLDQIDRHRSQIVSRLRGMVDGALATLRSAERLSVLPESLGEWGGQKFLRIQFDPADPATLDARLGQVVDDAAKTGERTDKAGGKRDGLSLLLKGVRAALPRGVKVDMLKPDVSMRVERIRIADVQNVFSGGQLLTAAIILYCTMAALRANDRGRTQRGHAGVLFLDNPIGRASAGYLLDLQLGVARSLGVQLIYTTGLFDLNALSVFPLIIRLRNDRDLRSGLNRLTVDDEIRTALHPLGDPDGTGRIQAARLYRRPPEPGR
ncbi:MAG: hypothetical protein M3Y42_10060 [Actinomycetota bacterium]|nr:hypothetical protein [Actinomycetota bacterium]MDQ2957296.1 hypothetical protein [Actinomycetota bacterium]